MKRYIPKKPRKKSFTGGNKEDREQGQLMAWIKAVILMCFVQPT